MAAHQVRAAVRLAAGRRRLCAPRPTQDNVFALQLANGVKGRADKRRQRLKEEGFYQPTGQTNPTRYKTRTSAPYKAALAILEAGCARADAAVAALTEQLAAVPGPAGPAPPPPAPPPPVAAAAPPVAAAASTAAAPVPTAASFMARLFAPAGAPQRLPTAPPFSPVALAVFPDSPPSAPSASSGGLSLVASGTTPLVAVTNRVDGGDVEVRRRRRSCCLPSVSLTSSHSEYGLAKMDRHPLRQPPKSQDLWQRCVRIPRPLSAASCIPRPHSCVLWAARSARMLRTRPVYYCAIQSCMPWPKVLHSTRASRPAVALHSAHQSSTWARALSCTGFAQATLTASPWSPRRRPRSPHPATGGKVPQWPASRSRARPSGWQHFSTPSGCPAAGRAASALRRSEQCQGFAHPVSHNIRHARHPPTRLCIWPSTARRC